MDKIFLRVNAWYKASNKELSSDIELSELIDDTSAEYPEIEVDGGGTVSIPATAYASNSEAVAVLGVGVLYNTTTVGLDGIQPFLSVTV